MSEMTTMDYITEAPGNVYNYFTSVFSPGGPSPAARPAAKAAKAAKAAREAPIAGGVYGPDNGWYYRYNAVTRSIHRAYPATGRQWERVANGGSAYKAISAMLPKLRRSNDATVKAIFKRHSSISVVPTVSSSGTVAPVAVVAAAMPTPSSRPEWLVPAVVVGGATLVLLIAFRPKKS